MASTIKSLTNVLLATVGLGFITFAEHEKIELYYDHQFLMVSIQNNSTTFWHKESLRFYCQGHFRRNDISIFNYDGSHHKKITSKLKYDDMAGEILCHIKPGQFVCTTRGKLTHTLICVDAKPVP